MDFATVSNSLAALALLSGGAGLILLVLLTLPPGRRWLGREVGAETRTLLGLACAIALGATGGSLYYSQIAGFIPCVLCWYQRIAMYPLVPILAIAAILGDRGVWRYGLPLSAAGLAIAVYHIVLQLRPALDVGACSAEAPCTMRYVAVFGFVSIPVMAAGGFLLISALLLTTRVTARPEV